MTVKCANKNTLVCWLFASFQKCDLQLKQDGTWNWVLGSTSHQIKINKISSVVTTLSNPCTSHARNLTDSTDCSFIHVPPMFGGNIVQFWKFLFKITFEKYKISVDMHNVWNWYSFSVFMVFHGFSSNTISSMPARIHGKSYMVESFPFFLPFYKEVLHVYFLFPVVQNIFMIIISDQ